MPFGGLLTVGLITAGIGTATSLYENSKATGAAQDATDKSLALQKSMYDTTRGDLAPFQQIGVGALGNLRQLTGLPPAAAAAGSSPMASTGALTAQGQKAAPPNTPIVGQAVPRPQTASRFVTMQAPDGTTNQVDPAHVGYYQNLGAQVVNASSYAPQQQAVSR